VRAAQAEAPVARPRTPAARTRVLSVASRAEEAPRRNPAPAILLAVVVAAGFAFHAWRVLQPRQHGELRAPAGAPSNAFSSTPAEAYGRQMLRSADGKPFKPDELRAFTEQEAARGNVVRELSPGILVVMPLAPPAPTK
jgi:hypothetical protein